MSETSAARSRLLAWGCLFILYGVWGTTYFAIRIVVREMPPFGSAGLRFLAAGLAMGLLALVFDRAQGWPTRRQWLEYSVAGVLFLAGGNAGVMWAEKKVPSGIAALLVATTPLWITFLDGLRPGGQRWRARVWVGVLLGLVGVALVARPGSGGESGHFAGIAALQAAALVWSIGALWVQSVERKLRILSAAAIEMVAGSAALFVESALGREDLGTMASASGAAWVGLCYLAVFGSLVGFTAFAYALDTLPASTVGTYAYVNPVVAVFLGHMFLAEPLSRWTVLGALIIIAAVVATTRGSMRADAAET